MLKLLDLIIKINFNKNNNKECLESKKSNSISQSKDNNNRCKINKIIILQVIIDLINSIITIINSNRYNNKIIVFIRIKIINSIKIIMQIIKL